MPYGQTHRLHDPQTVTPQHANRRPTGASTAAAEDAAPQQAASALLWRAAAAAVGVILLGILVSIVCFPLVLASPIIYIGGELVFLALYVQKHQMLSYSPIASPQRPLDYCPVEFFEKATEHLKQVRVCGCWCKPGWVWVCLGVLGHVGRNMCILPAGKYVCACSFVHASVHLFAYLFVCHMLIEASIAARRVDHVINPPSHLLSLAARCIPDLTSTPHPAPLPQFEDVRAFLSLWFRGAPFSELRRGNVAELLAYAFFYKTVRGGLGLGVRWVMNHALRDGLTVHVLLGVFWQIVIGVFGGRLWRWLER